MQRGVWQGPEPAGADRVRLWRAARACGVASVRVRVASRLVEAEEARLMAPLDILLLSTGEGECKERARAPVRARAFVCVVCVCGQVCVCVCVCARAHVHAISVSLPQHLCRWWQK